MEKFIKIEEKNDRVSMESFADELKNINIYDNVAAITYTQYV